MKKLLFITGTRADFGKIKTILSQIQREPSIELHVFVTGMHVLSKYGLTYNEIKDAGVENAFLYFNQTESNHNEMDIVLAKTIEGLGYYVREFQPDLIVVHGDRVETLAGAIIGALNNIRVAHIEGGEISGTVDEVLRHAISKLSHVHFVSNERAKRVLMQMGEKSETIYVIGSPDIDVMLSNDLPSLAEAKAHYEIDFKEYAIFCYHPVTTELHKLQESIKFVIDALKISRKNYIVIYPNNDRGSDMIFREIDTLKSDTHFRVFPSIRFEYFLVLLKNAEFIIGNSSAGVREAPIYGLPTIDIGTRESGRNCCESVTHVEESTEDIVAAINNIKRKYRPNFAFGRGKSAEKILRILMGRKIWDIKHQKRFVVRDMED